jgi:hypothetical protein
MIGFKGRRVVSQAGGPVPLGERISGTPRPTGVTKEPFDTAYPNGVLHGIAADSARISVHSAGIFKSAAVYSSIAEYSYWIASLSNIDPQLAQLNDVDLLFLCPLSWRIQIGSRLQQYSY